MGLSTDLSSHLHFTVSVFPLIITITWLLLLQKSYGLLQDNGNLASEDSDYVEDDQKENWVVAKPIAIINKHGREHYVKHSLQQQSTRPLSELAANGKDLNKRKNMKGVIAKKQKLYNRFSKTKTAALNTSNVAHQTTSEKIANVLSIKKKLQRSSANELTSKDESNQKASGKKEANPLSYFSFLHALQSFSALAMNLSPLPSYEYDDKVSPTIQNKFRPLRTTWPPIPRVTEEYIPDEDPDYITDYYLKKKPVRKRVTTTTTTKKPVVGSGKVAATERNWNPGVRMGPNSRFKNGTLCHVKDEAALCWDDGSCPWYQICKTVNCVTDCQPRIGGEWLSVKHNSAGLYPHIEFVEFHPPETTTTTQKTPTTKKTTTTKKKPIIKKKTGAQKTNNQIRKRPAAKAIPKVQTAKKAAAQNFDVFKVD